MPKLTPLVLVERINKRIEQLEHGDQLEARDINVLLTTEQQKKLAEAWADQQSMRKLHRTKASAEKAGLVWKTKTEVRLEIYRQALTEAVANLPNALEDRLYQQEVRGARIFMDAYCEAEKAGKIGWTAANNALRRAGLNRLDGKSQVVGNKRDRTVWAMEEKLRILLEADMTGDEREQLELLAEHERSLVKNGKGR